MMTELLAIFLSFSFRSANLPEKPNDYEVGGGFKVYNFMAEGYKERENGIKYDIFKTEHKSDYTEVSYYLKEAQGIDSQSVSVFYPVRPAVSIGMTENWQAWKDGATLAYLKFQTSSVMVRFQKGDGREIFTARVGKQFPLPRSMFYLEPMAVYERVDSKRFWQGKLVVGIRI